jgi:hypothetical protein
MIRRGRDIAASIVFIVLLGTIAGITLIYDQKIRRKDKRLDRLDQYCLTVHEAIRIDVKELRDVGHVERQAAAADRLFGQAAAHDEESYKLCVGEYPDTTGRDRCWLSKNYECLASMGEAALERTPR